MRTLQPKEITIIRSQPSVMINHSEPSVPTSMKKSGHTKRNKAARVKNH